MPAAVKWLDTYLPSDYGGKSTGTSTLSVLLEGDNTLCVNIPAQIQTETEAQVFAYWRKPASYSVISTSRPFYPLLTLKAATTFPAIKRRLLSSFLIIYDIFF